VPFVEKIASGGQTRADRAALDWAIENGIPRGSRCPQDRLAEDGAIPARYNLAETPPAIFVDNYHWSG
jgi:hypothetical protein